MLLVLLVISLCVFRLTALWLGYNYPHYLPTTLALFSLVLFSSGQTAVIAAPGRIKNKKHEHTLL